MALVTDHAPLGIARCCRAVGLARATYYRARAPRVHTCRAPRPTLARALAPVERAHVLGLLHQPRFVDLAPGQVYATLLDEGTYYCSERTMYRLLAAAGETQRRRAQRTHPPYAAPELLATAPNQLWSWDITKLRGPVRGIWYALYVVLDVFSRYVVGWRVAARESGRLARELLHYCMRAQQIPPHQLTIHADRGGPMQSQPVTWLLADLGVTRSHSRPQVSNDNPYSESQFKTLKYHPTFPNRFGSLIDARAYCAPFFGWYNTGHHHQGLGWHTPVEVHTGIAHSRRAERARVLNAAYAARPERFVRHAPVPPALPTRVWINEPKGLIRTGVTQ